MNEERRKVSPREGLTVRDPVTRQPIEPGTEVVMTRELYRLVRSGDLVMHDLEVGTDQGTTDDGTERERA